MFSTEQAWQTICAHAGQLDAVQIPLDAALGKTLRVDARADVDSPSFDASAMDGYATVGASPKQRLRVVGESAAGFPFGGVIGAGECVRIFTGAPVPLSATRVIKQEDVTRDGDYIQVARVDGPVFIRRRGENRRTRDVIAAAGAALTPAALAALASAGVTRPTVTRAARCVHLVTGDEVIPPEQKPTGAQIRDSNSTLVAALLSGSGAELVGHARAHDDLSAAEAIARNLPAHDVLLISGGASVGDRDFARPLLERLGYTLHFQTLNLRPGKPLVFATRGPQLAFALPGNPVSHWVVFHLFVGPLLRHLQTGNGTQTPRLKGKLAAGSSLPLPDHRHTFWPSHAVIVQGFYEVAPLPLASSGDSSGLASANALLSMPTDTRALASGDLVEFILCS